MNNKPALSPQLASVLDAARKSAKHYPPGLRDQLKVYFGRVSVAKPGSDDDEGGASD